jgi:biopolymer transport protein ExbD
MAEIAEGGKKGAPRVDMTPMVDLGFLLITFFMLTTTFSKPNTMELNMPDKNEEVKEEMPVPASKTLSIILDKDNKVWWYKGKPSEAKPELTDFSSNGIRRVLLEQSKLIGVDSKGKNAMVVVIKPKDEAVYKNMVDILDEMHITNTQRYAIVEIMDEDLAAIKKVEGGL